MSVPQSMDRVGNILLLLKTKKKKVAVHSVDTNSTPDKAALGMTASLTGCITMHIKEKKLLLKSSAKVTWVKQQSSLNCNRTLHVITKQKKTNKQQKHIFVHIVLYIYLAVAIMYTNIQHCI